MCFGLLRLPWSALVCLGLSWSVLVCFGLPWSTLICLGLLGLFQITIERLECSKAISGLGMGMGWDRIGWKSLLALILRAPLCGANKGIGDAGSTADIIMLWSAIVCLGLL